MIPPSDPPGHGSRKSKATSSSAVTTSMMMMADPPEQRSTEAVDSSSSSDDQQHQQNHQTLEEQPTHEPLTVNHHTTETTAENQEDEHASTDNNNNSSNNHDDDLPSPLSRSATPTSLHSGFEETLSVASSTISSSKMTLSTVGSSFYSRRTESEILEEDDDDDDDDDDDSQNHAWFCSTTTATSTTKHQPPHPLEEFPEEYVDPESSSTSGHSSNSTTDDDNEHHDNEDEDGSTERFYSEFTKKQPEHSSVVGRFNILRCCFPWSATTRSFVRKLLVRTAVVFTFFILVINWGMRRQRHAVSQAPDTTHFYTTPKVCGLTYAEQPSSSSEQLSNDVFANNNNNNNPSPSGETTTTSSPSILLNTFSTAADARASPDTWVAHCGDCGACSNPHDVRIYDQTRNTLFEDTVKCASTGLLGGHNKAHQCMEDRVGFTPECNECWVENIFCSIRSCTFICMWHGLFGSVDKTEDSRALTPCTECDEKMCGPDFITCAGANRRRSGILSDLQRNEDVEVCQQVETGWWNDPQLQEDYQEQLAEGTAEWTQNGLVDYAQDDIAGNDWNDTREIEGRNDADAPNEGGTEHHNVYHVNRKRKRVGRT